MKNNLKISYLVILNFFFMFSSLLFSEDINTSQDITISGNIMNLQLESHKALLNIDVKENDVLKGILPVSKTILDKTPKVLMDPSLITPDIVYSFNAISPFSIDIFRSPFLNFSIGGNKLGDIDEWTFVFTDPRGEVFSTINGKKSIPKELPWDGVSSVSKSLIMPGQSYSYILKIKEGENVQTIKGDHFSIKGIYFEKPEYKDIRLALNEIFDINTNSVIMKPNSNLILKEAIDVLKEFYDCNMNIIVYDKNVPIAQKRADVLKKYIKTNMYTNNIKIVSLGKQVYISDYRIDIVILNRNQNKKKDKK